MLGFSVPTMAQDNKTTIDAITKVIKSKGSDVSEQVKDVYKKNKKNTEVLVAIGRAYLDVKDTANAQKYADFAMKADKKYAPSYILAGDIQVVKDDGGAAAGYYQQAIYWDPKDPSGYYKYANIYRGRSPEEAVNTLNALRTQRPDLAVDALAARIYYSSNIFDKCLASYEKVDKSKLEDVDITNYAMAAYLTQKRQKCLDMSLYGLTKDPRNAAWNRLAFYNYTDDKKFTDALNYADRLFNASDSAKISAYDYTYYGTALMGAKQYDKAITMFKNAIENQKDTPEKNIDIKRQLADAYAAKEDFADAISSYQDYLDSNTKATASDYAAFAGVYRDQAQKLTGAQQTEAYKNSDRIYGQLGEKFPKAIDFANFMRARINSYMDPDTKTGLAKPYYEALAASLSQKANLDETDKTRLMESYRYLGYYYLLKQDKATSNGYWKKLLELDPTNETAKQALQQK